MSSALWLGLWTLAPVLGMALKQRDVELGRRMHRAPPPRPRHHHHHHHHHHHDQGGELTSIIPFLEKELTGIHFKYIVMPGNAGDVLINHGTMLVFEHLGLTFDTAAIVTSFSNQTLVCAGNGNMVGLYHDFHQFLEINAPVERGNKIIVLPSTVAKADATLATLKSNVVFFTRDRPSYEYVQSHVPQNVFLSKDMAFYMDGLSKELPDIQASAPKSDKGYMFRTDKEKTSVALPPGNKDWSNKFPGVHFKHAAKFMAQSTKASNMLLRKIAEYRVIFTNRLHLCIGGSMIGRESHCEVNNYFKLEAIYNYSIRDVYPKTHLHQVGEAMTSVQRYENTDADGVIMEMCVGVQDQLFKYMFC